MTHDTPLITTIVVGLVLAFLFGAIANRLRLPMIAGYLMAGVVIGPFTPGYVADQNIASELAELGVILLMFGVGLHFSLRDLMSVRRIAIPGALVQISAAILCGMALAWALGWSMGAGMIFGLSLSVASTVVLLRGLQERGLEKEERGRIAIGWLIVEDLVMVVVLVLIPPLSSLLGGRAVPIDEGAAEVARLGIGPVAATLMITAVKVAGFIALMLVVGRKLIPKILHYTAHTGQRELFRLGVLATALGVAWGSAKFFGVSFALGAFFAGMVMAGSSLSAQAMKDTLPLRDAFAVLFFVSVGMLFDPSVILSAPLSLLATVVIIIGVKASVAYGLVRAFGHDRRVAMTIAASLAQIGEFSFILITMGVSLTIVPSEARDLVVAGALVSILANPVLFHLVDRHVTAKAHPGSA
jgi:CPA2 family monovalent cation:H+ antiporter-2